MKLIRWIPLVFVVACGSASDGGPHPGPGPGGNPNPGGGNVSFGGGGDFAAFRQALDDGRVPSPESIEPTGFFAEHHTTLPSPTCGDRLCLHAMLSVAPDLVHGGTQTLLQLGVNTPLDPETFPRPPLDLVVVVDKSGSMAGAGKITYARDGVKLLVDELGPEDRLTLIAFDDEVELLYGPARVTDRAAIKERVDGIEADGATNLHDSLKLAFEKALQGLETSSRRVIFLTDGIATAGETDPEAILAMARGYVRRYVQLTTIGLGRDVNLGLLRTLAEEGSGNFYFLEEPAAAREVFTRELRFFVAPIAYDVEVAFDAGDAYDVAALSGSSLWQSTAGGGRIERPSVYLASRTSDEPDPSGGRRGGGAALLAELEVAHDDSPGHRVANASLRYRVPGRTTFESMVIPVTYGDHPGVCGEAGYASHAPIGKNAIILGFYAAFHEATVLARQSPVGARELLERFQERVERRLEGSTDDDLQDDLVLLARFIAVLSPAR
jgi:Ca-activated chloride channel family protein